jgi:hypothetical protein
MLPVARARLNPAGLSVPAGLHFVSGTAAGCCDWGMDPYRLGPTERLAVASRMGYFPQLTDDAALTTLYGADVCGGPGNFHIIRDNQILDAVSDAAPQLHAQPGGGTKRWEIPLENGAERVGEREGGPNETSQLHQGRQVASLCAEA